MLLTVKSPIANIYNNNKKSEIVTQILLGENFITQNKFGKFFKGYKAYDKYEGFIEAKDLHLDKRKKTHKIMRYYLIYIYIYRRQCENCLEVD
jgi:hypothetical protein